MNPDMAIRRQVKTDKRVELLKRQLYGVDKGTVSRGQGAVKSQNQSGQYQLNPTLPTINHQPSVTNQDNYLKTDLIKVLIFAAGAIIIQITLKLAFKW